LGGNISLKMAGEDGSRPSGNLDSVVTVSAPFDLEVATHKMGLPQNKLFERFFLKQLQSDLALMQKINPDMPKLIFPNDMSIRKFDELHTVPVNGFKDLADYYRSSSAKYYIPEIKIPTLIVSAMDDPVAAPDALLSVSHSANVDVLLTEHGGHCGFLGFGTEYNEVRWSDQAVARWLEDTVAG
jgi:predicted alpha/beta-fold hydrolase